MISYLLNDFPLCPQTFCHLHTYWKERKWLHLRDTETNCINFALIHDQISIEYAIYRVPLYVPSDNERPRKF